MSLRVLAIAVAVAAFGWGCVDAPTPTPEVPVPIGCTEAIARDSIDGRVACGALDDGTGTGNRIYCLDHCAPLGFECVNALDEDGAVSVAGSCGVHPCVNATCGAELLGKVCLDTCNLWETIGAGPNPAAPPTALVWPAARAHASMVARSRRDGSRTVVLFGGASVDGEGLQPLDDAFELFARGDEFIWERLAGGPPARYGASMATWSAEGGDLVFLFGGLAADGLARSDLWMLDDDGWRELPVTGEVLSRVHGGLAVDPGPPARLVQFGGEDEHGVEQESSWELLLDEATPSWREFAIGGDGPAARKGHVLVRDESEGDLLLIGGDLPNRKLSGELWRLRGERWELERTDAMEKRRFASASWDPSHRRVIVYGGFGDAGDYTSACDWTFPGESGWHNDDTWAFERQGGRYLVSRPLVSSVDFPNPLREFIDVEDVRCPTGRFGASLAPAPRDASTPDHRAGLVLFGGRFQANGVHEVRSDLSHYVPLPRYLAER